MLQFQIKLKDALNNFFTSPAWEEMKGTGEKIRHKFVQDGFSEAWEEFIVSIDPEGETHAYRVSTFQIHFTWGTWGMAQLIWMPSLLHHRGCTILVVPPWLHHPGCTILVTPPRSHHPRCTILDFSVKIYDIVDKVDKLSMSVENIHNSLGKVYRNRTNFKRFPFLLQVLNIGSNADEQEVAAAYRRLVKEWHPDKHKDPKMKTIAEVHELCEICVNFRKNIFIKGIQFCISALR